MTRRASVLQTFSVACVTCRFHGPSVRGQPRNAHIRDILKCYFRRAKKVINPVKVVFLYLRRGAQYSSTTDITVFVPQRIDKCISVQHPSKVLNRYAAWSCVSNACHRLTRTNRVFQRSQRTYRIVHMFKSNPVVLVESRVLVHPPWRVFEGSLEKAHFLAVQNLGQEKRLGLYVRLKPDVVQSVEVRHDRRCTESVARMLVE